MLRRIFDNQKLLYFFHITEPTAEYFYDVYVANCAKKVYFEGNFGPGGFSYPGWKIVNCEDQGCCVHTYKVNYRWNCNSSKNYIVTNWYNNESTSSSSENCTTPCFLNCYNWSIYSGPPMNRVESDINDDNYDLIVDLNNNLRFDLTEQIKQPNNEHINYQLRVYELSGNLLFESNINKNIDIKEILKTKKMQSQVYMYEVKDGETIKLKGKILIKN